MTQIEPRHQRSNLNKYNNFNFLKKIIMQKIFFVLFLLAFAQITAFAQSRTDEALPRLTDAKGITTTTLNVSGNCGMCKRRIEEACVIRGVKSAKWDAKTSVLSVSFDSKRTNLDKIGAAIAKAGYDNDRAKTSDKAYNKLPQCCQYKDEKAAKH
jgi:periplasmic mercuric ion binding protein